LPCFSFVIPAGNLRCLCFLLSFPKGICVPGASYDAQKHYPLILDNSFMYIYT
jgi:hypothetical protein